MCTAISGAMASPSTLRVAVCQPGQAPYVITTEDGMPAGFDVGNDPIVSCFHANSLMHLSQTCGTKLILFF